MKPMTIAMLISWIITIVLLITAAILLAADSGETGMNFGYAFALMAALFTGLIALIISILNVISWTVERRKG